MTQTVRVRNFRLLTGRHEIGEQPVTFNPQLLRADRWGLILLWDEKQFPYLKLVMSLNKQVLGSGPRAYQTLVEQLDLAPAMHTPPPNIAWSCILEPGRALTVGGSIDTNDMRLYETVRNFTNEFVDDEAILTYPIKGILVAGSANEGVNMEIALFPPAGPLGAGQPRSRSSGYRPPPFDGYVGLDLGNHSSTIAAVSLRARDETILLQESLGGGHVNASLHSDAKPISSSITYRSVIDGKFDDSLSSIEFVIGRFSEQSANRSMDGVELAAKRLAASPYYQVPKEYRISNRNSMYPGEQKSLIDIGFPRRLAAELLTCRLLHMFREGARAFPSRIAVSYPTTFSEREVNQLREVVYRGWLRSLPRSQDEESIRVVLNRQFPGPARLAGSEGILLMLDEASAAAFFFLFERILKAYGQLSRFRYLYPHGLNLLLFDCGGGTTDVALVRALVRPEQPRKLVLTVRGRVGHRHFGGDFITEQVYRLLKAKAAVDLSVEMGDKPIPRFPQGASFETVDTYLKRNADAIDKIIPTKFVTGGPETTLSNDGLERQKRSFALWRIAEQVKIKLAETDIDKPVKVPSTEWGALPNLNEDRRVALEKLTISRAEVDALVTPRLRETIKICNTLIRKKLIDKTHTGLDEVHDDPEEVHWLVVAGAASKYPLITEELRETLDVPFLNSSDEEFQQSRMTKDEANLKHAVAKGLANILMIKDSKDIELEFDSELSRRLPYEIVYLDRIGLRRVLFRENVHLDTLLGVTQSLTPQVTNEAPLNSDDDEEAGHYVLLNRRFPGEDKDTPYLKYYFRNGVIGKLEVEYKPDSGPNLFVMTNMDTYEEGECEDVSPEESYFHPVQRGDL